MQSVTLEVPDEVIKLLKKVGIYREGHRAHYPIERITMGAVYAAVYPRLAADPKTNPDQLKQAKHYFDKFFPEGE